MSEVLSDRMEQLWTPYRMEYLSSKRSSKGITGDCPFCIAPQHDDEKHLVVARGEHVYALLNLYPYNAGHVMVCPYRHVPDYTDLSTDELVELGEFTQRTMHAVREVSDAAGFNIGMNQGGAAGAGIADHLHQHIVPRWGGDTNFMPIIGMTKVLPQLLADTRALLAEAWRAPVGSPRAPRRLPPSSA